MSTPAVDLPEVTRAYLSPREFRLIHALVCAAAVEPSVRACERAGMDADVIATVRAGLETSSRMMLAGAELTDDEVRALQEKTLFFVKLVR